MNDIITDVDELLDKLLKGPKQASHLDKGAVIEDIFGNRTNSKSNMVINLPSSWNQCLSRSDDSGIPGKLYKKYFERILDTNSLDLWPQLSKKKHRSYNFRGGKESDAGKLLKENSDKLINCIINSIDEEKIYKHDEDNYEIAEKLYTCAFYINPILADGLTELKQFRKPGCSAISMNHSDIDKIRKNEYKVINLKENSNIIYERKKKMKHVFQKGNNYKRTGMSDCVAEIFIKNHCNYNFNKIFEELKKYPEFSYLNITDEKHIKRVKDALSSKATQEVALYDDKEDEYIYRTQNVNPYRKGNKKNPNKIIQNIVNKYKLEPVDTSNPEPTSTTNSKPMSVSEYVPVATNSHLSADLELGKYINEVMKQKNKVTIAREKEKIIITLE